MSAIAALAVFHSKLPNRNVVLPAILDVANRMSALPQLLFLCATSVVRLHHFFLSWRKTFPPLVS